VYVAQSPLEAIGNAGQGIMGASQQRQTAGQQQALQKQIEEQNTMLLRALALRRQMTPAGDAPQSASAPGDFAAPAETYA
jgi:hypothetical protein